MKTSKILLGLLVVAGCSKTSADTANPGDLAATQGSTLAASPEAADADEPTSMDDLDMDEFRNDGSEDAKPYVRVNKPEDEDEDESYEDESYEDEDYEDEDYEE